MSTPNPLPSIPKAPAPWTLKATVYLFATYTSPHNSSIENSPQPPVPPLGYSSLESTHSPFTTNSKFAGGLGSVQLIRYSESPVGPYDELLIVPGSFEWEEDLVKGGKRKSKNVRVSRIYVSQRDTCWNGRKNWNIPKHLARFQFITLPTSPPTTKFTVHPTENPPNSPPFFTATFKPLPYLPSFPFTTRILKYLGADPTLVQPPLPEGEGEEGELCGTEEWMRIVPGISSGRCALGWWDLSQEKGEGFEGEENWWPGGGRWRLGIKMDRATVLFPEGEVLRVKNERANL